MVESAEERGLDSVPGHTCVCRWVPVGPVKPEACKELECRCKHLWHSTMCMHATLLCGTTDSFT